MKITSWSGRRECVLTRVRLGQGGTLEVEQACSGGEVEIESKHGIGESDKTAGSSAEFFRSECKKGEVFTFDETAPSRGAGWKRPPVLSRLGFRIHR